MLKIRIIPCLDVKDGRVVKGINFLNLVDAGDPVEQASFYSKNGADEICFLDIGASIENRNTMIKVVEKTAEKVFIPLTVGGGIKNIENIRDLLKAGADKISINTAGILNNKLISDSSERFGSQCIVAAVDAKKKNNGWTVFSHGGTKDTGLDAIKWMQQLESLGAGEILLTSMDRDGTKDGFDIDLLKKASKVLNIPVIASGGAGRLEHFKAAVIRGNASALLAASVFHFAKFSIMDVKKYLKKENIEVRYLNE
ncbi:MAG: Imidazole glycerol phosphate synthase subunit HisF [Alphaproteobacteria bacterium MarineAlpha5_Bin8]|nr:MAG: Imidazole glycerol phosphate synthase subunit HisF [Alphaproteobacteria bacterium MarineAlpha5_Bin7]PPR48160.1 MAG: Imidazole glycerol phosphate synthase subunit HisF [Alphaproteobacteria bacterium MarineAlpha5_Bin8]PPR54735.1 MAG: Imidazole glycerol phosphate synthase subunit HisF [Alphaproteobacteria bacterium MarineAlpha5_Bin6]|tara:strand:- start:656 stop:1420 length:765 start_codon:yes stop_codon:yes gene_type:complete